MGNARPDPILGGRLKPYYILVAGGVIYVGLGVWDALSYVAMARRLIKAQKFPNTIDTKASVFVGTILSILFWPFPNATVWVLERIARLLDKIEERIS